MLCPYCRAHYSLEESCFCLPRNRESKVDLSAKVTGPWGEAAASWSMTEDATEEALNAA
jgi:hypothetical protein